MSESPAGFQPHVPPSETPPELTFRAVLLGALLGIVYGAASTYLALRVGLTVSASVPIAVLAIALLRKRNGQRAILEHNVTQTAGSAGESVAAALAFTVPALIVLGYPMQLPLTALIAITGGLLGVLLMVPLRRYLIVKEHGKLRYPEGKACAEILMAGEKGGTSARKVLQGMLVGVAFKAFQAILGGVKLSLEYPITLLKGAKVACDFEPPLVGVGYILGYRTSLIMVAGSLLATFILVPIIILFGQHSTTAISPSAGKLISGMTEGEVWKTYVKQIGAGAVAAGGMIALLRALPAIVSALVASARGLFGRLEELPIRTDRDAPLPVLTIGALVLIAIIWLVPAFQMNLPGALLVLVLGFLFAVVCSRITGEVGSSSCPLSGMTIAVLMVTCGFFILTGRTGMEWSKLAITIGAVVCIAISNSGTCSQDLKTGFLVGATPWKQQTALLIGVLACVPAVGWTAVMINEVEARETRIEQPFVVPAAILETRTDVVRSKTDKLSYRFVQLSASEAPPGAGNYLVDPATRTAVYKRVDGIGEKRFPAPQATLMANVIRGMLGGTLQWDLILLGVAIALFVELLGFGALTFAVGVYLPLGATTPVFLGGLVRKLADRRYGRVPDAEDEPEGTLWCSGLIAGASILAVLATMQGFFDGYDGDNGYHPAVAMLKDLPVWMDEIPHGADLFGAAVIGLLCWLMFRGAAKRS